MIIRFAMSNFHSFNHSDKPVDCINMNASKFRNLSNHIFLEENILKSSVFFGGNGAGKTNIFKGIEFLKKIVLSDRPVYIDDHYCKYDSDNITKPIKFEIDFIKRNEYGNVFPFIDWNFNRMSGYGLSKVEFDGDIISYKRYRYCIDIIGDHGIGTILRERIYDITIENKPKEIYKYEMDQKYPIDDSIDGIGISPIDLSEPDEQNLISKMDLLKQKLIELSIKSDFYKEQLSKKEILDSYEKSATLNKQELIQKEIENIKKQLEIYENDLFDSYIENNLIFNEKILCDNSKRSKKNKKLNSKIHLALHPLKEHDGCYDSYKSWEVITAMRDIYSWFSDTLSIINVRQMITPTNGFRDLGLINKFLRYFDAKIESISYKIIDNHEELEDVMWRLPESEIKKYINLINNKIIGESVFSKVLRKGENIYEFEFSRNNLVVKKLITIHHDGSEHNLVEESDGTRRLIELLYALVDSRFDKVYVIDELDRRLHPLITRNFVDTFFENCSETTQLLFSTHESRLATTNLFRLDEINLVGKDKNHSTIVVRANNAVGEYKKRFDEMYLDGQLGGVPNIHD